MIGIYKITSPSGKIYIGQSVNIERRFKWHKKNSFNLNSKLSNSFKKHGIDNHVFEVIEECDVDSLNNKERYWQEHYDVINKGLNLLLTKTNDKSGFASIEVKAKLSEMRRGIKHSKERKLKNSLSKLGVKHSEERILINKISHTGLKQSEETRLKKKAIGLKINECDNIRFACGKLLLNTQTGIYYYGLVPASESANLNRVTLSHKVSGRLKNDTPFIRV